MDIEIEGKEDKDIGHGGSMENTDTDVNVTVRSLCSSVEQLIMLDLKNNSLDNQESSHQGSVETSKQNSSRDTSALKTVDGKGPKKASDSRNKENVISLLETALNQFELINKKQTDLSLFVERRMDNKENKKSKSSSKIADAKIVVDFSAFIDMLEHLISNGQSTKNRSDPQSVIEGSLSVQILLNMKLVNGIDLRLISEENLEKCVDFIKYHWNDTLLKYLDESIPSGTLNELIVSGNETSLTKSSKFVTITTILSRLSDSLRESVVILGEIMMKNSTTLSEMLVSQLIPVLFRTFIIDTLITTGGRMNKSKLGAAELMTKNIQTSASMALRSFFLSNSENRMLILDELVDTLIKSPWHQAARKNNENESSSSKSILNSVLIITTLALELCQGCCVFEAPSLSRFLKNAEKDENTDEKRNGDASKSNSKSGFMQSIDVATYIVSKLVSRAYENKGDEETTPTKSKANENESSPLARECLSGFTEDLLNVFNSPEWPCADMYLTLIIRFISNLLAGKNKNQTTNAESSISRDIYSSVDIVGRILSKVQANSRFVRENPLSNNLLLIWKKRNGMLASEDTTTFDETEKKERNSNDEEKGEVMRKPKNASPNDESEVIACSCGKGFSDQKFMIDCDMCQSWFHGYCVNVDMINPPKKWTCDDCSVICSVQDQLTKATNSGKSTKSNSNNSNSSVSKQRKSSNNKKSKISNEADDKERDDKVIHTIDSDRYAKSFQLQMLRQLYLNYLASEAIIQNSFAHLSAYMFVVSQWCHQQQFNVNKNSKTKEMNDSISKQIRDGFNLCCAMNMASFDDQYYKSIRKKHLEDGQSSNDEENDDSEMLFIQGSGIQARSLIRQKKTASLSLFGTRRIVKLLSVLDNAHGDDKMKMSGRLCSENVKTNLIQRLIWLMTSSHASLRTRAVKALSQMIEQDPLEVMTSLMVKEAVEQRILDESVSVREAILDLIGRFVLVSPNIADMYLVILVQRLSDSGLSVRKRVVKILKDITQIIATESKNLNNPADFTNRDPGMHKSPVLSFFSLLQNDNETKITVMFMALLERLIDPNEEESLKNLIIANMRDFWFDSESLQKISQQKGYDMARMLGIRVCFMVDLILMIPNHDWLAILLKSLFNEPVNVTVVSADSSKQMNGEQNGEEEGEASMTSASKRSKKIDNDEEYQVSIKTPGSSRKRGNGNADSSALKESVSKNRKQILKEATRLCTEYVDLLMKYLVSAEEQDHESTTVVPKSVSTIGSRPEKEPEKWITITQSERVIAILQTLKIFCFTKPQLLINQNLVSILCYLKGKSSMNDEDEPIVICEVCQMLSLIIPVLDQSTVSHPFMKKTVCDQIENDLVKLVYSKPPICLKPVIELLSKFCRYVTKKSQSISSIMEKFIQFLRKFQALHSIEGQHPSSIDGIQRALYVCGLLCLNYDFGGKQVMSDGKYDYGSMLYVDEVFELVMHYLNIGNKSKMENNETKQIEDNEDDGNDKDSIDDVYLDEDEAIISISDISIKRCALQALGFLCCRSHRLLSKKSVIEKIERCLSDQAPSIRHESLHVLRDLLEAEEIRLERGMAKENLEKTTTKEQRVNEDQDSDASLLSSIVQSNSDAILDATYDPDEEVRINALKLVGTMLRQGLINPMQCVIPLIVMESDHKQDVRDLGFQQLSFVYTRYSEFVLTRSTQAIIKSFIYQTDVYRSVQSVVQPPSTSTNPDDSFESQNEMDLRTPTFSIFSRVYKGFFSSSLKNVSCHCFGCFSSYSWFHFFVESHILLIKIEKQFCLFIGEPI